MCHIFHNCLMGRVIVLVSAIVTLAPTVRCSTTAQVCRMSYGYLPKDLYASFTCGQCFYYTFLQSNKQYSTSYFILPCAHGVVVCDKRKFTSETGQDNNGMLPDWCSCDNKEVVYNLPEFSNHSVHLDQLKLEPKLPYDFVALTRDCCNEAKKCCNAMLEEENDTFATTELETDGSTVEYCPHTWDGWHCWPKSLPGSVQRGICPEYTYAGWGRDSVKRNPEEYYSLKTCTENGTWLKRQQTKAEWTDYSNCATLQMNEEVVKHIVGISAFAVSVITVIPAIIIFSVYRSLQVDRITIHKHLLFSFLLTGILYIFNNTFFVADDAYGAPLVENNHISCRLLFLVQLRYLRLANYMWMLCEGLYLYKFLIDAFAEHRSMTVYYLLGWVFPIIPTISYAVLRTELDNDKCWIISTISWIEWSTFGPCILSLAVNFILMINIMSVLITKLRQGPANEPAQFRKAVRATLLLLPMFGLHFFITIYRHHNLWYEIVNKLLDGLQGFIVAFIICYTHGEVIDLLKKTWRVYRMQKKCDRESRRTKKSFHSSASEHCTTLL